MTGRLRTFALVALAVAAIAAAGCGGGGRDTIEPAPAVERQPSLLGGGEPQDTSAGEVESYEPTGEIVADSGFRPWADGFGFENYGNDAGPQNMTPAEVEDLFGSQVCASGTGADCELIPTAQEWMEIENERMGGGHCMGFSVTANQFWAEVRDVADYGADQPIDLPVQGNTDLQALIAENWTYQDLPSVQEEQVTGTPTEILDVLIDSLNDEEGELYTVAIFKRDGTAGHAVTPFAIEDHDDGTYSILVYDNNFPGVVRAIAVDANEDTWSYIGGPDPSDTDQLYEGDADTESLSLFPTSPGDELQPCFFCSGEGVDPDDPSTGSVPAAAERYAQISLTGSPSNHGHLILRDDKGRVTGFVGDRIVNKIPGVRIQRTITSQNWREAPEPTYLVPASAAVSVTIDGSGLEKPDKEQLTLIGPGLYAQVDDIDVRPGAKNVIEFEGGGTGFIFHTDPRFDQTPILTSAIEENGKFYVFGAAALGIKGGSTLTMYFETDTGNFALDTEGTKGNIEKTGYALYVLSFVRVTDKGDSTWTSDELLIRSGELALVDYRKAPARNKPLQIYTATPDGEEITSVQTAKPDNA